MRVFSASWCLALSISCTALFSTAVANKKPADSKPSKPLYSFDQLWKLEKEFWDAFLYPANTKQTQGNQSTIFAADVRKPNLYISTDGN
jgi:hypothetical protein